jgi:imidazolonepropionase-like amidohydrolase
MNASEVWLADLRVIDTETGVVSKSAMRVVDGHVAQIAEQPPAGSPTESLDGAYVLPGLISMHTHLQGIYPHSLRDVNEPVATTALRAAWRARQTVRAGITTVRCMHEQSAVDIALRESIRTGRSFGPRIFAAGRALTTTGGHAHRLGCRIADGEDEFLRAGREELAGGADQLKVMASGGLAGAGESLDKPQMTLAEMRGAVMAAEQHDTYVTAHSGGSATIRRGIEAGIRSFEHAYRLDTETAALMAEAEVFLTPTLVVTNVLEWMTALGFSAESMVRSRAVSDEHLESITRAVAAGVTIVMGTDFPPSSHDRGVPLAVREMELLVKAGLSPLGAIQAATRNASRLLAAPELGRVEIGSPADLVGVRGNPIEDIAAMEDITVVVQGGEIVRRGPFVGDPL